MSVVGRSQQALSGFDPVSLGGCALWLDAADARTLTLSGSNVTAWADKSGNGRNTSTFGVAPTFSNGAVRFSSNQGFSVNLTASSSVESGFIVAGATATNDTISNTLLGSANGNGGRQFRIPSAIQTIKQNVAGVLFTGTTLPSNTTQLVEFVNDGTTLTHYWNGSVYGSASSVAYDAGRTTSIGRRFENVTGDGGEWFTGYIQEVIVFSNALTTTQRQAVEGYLAWKWNTPTTPLDVPGCALWLDAADTTSMTLSGSNVTQWRDKSGNSNHATAAGNAAVLSSNSVVFTGVHGTSSTRFTIADTASLRLTTPFSIHMVYSATALTPTSGNAFGSMVLLGKFPEGSGYPGWNYRARGFNGDLSAIFFNSAANQGDATVINQNVVDGTRKLITLNQRTSDTMYTFVNGSADSTITPFAPPISSTDTLILGARNATQTSNTPFNGSVNEIIIHTGSLSRDQCQQIETYLARKWSMSLPYNARYPRLPTTHPYRTTLPVYRDFSPLDIDGLSLWLDAADRNSMTIVGSNVTQWNDKSGSGYVLAPTSGTVTTTTQNGLNVVDLGASGRIGVSNYPWRSYSTTFFVVKNLNILTHGGGSPYTYSTYIYPGNYALAFIRDTADRLELYDGVNALGTSVVPSDAYYLFSWGYAGGTTPSVYNVNGTARTTRVFYGTGRADVFNTALLELVQGQACELLMFNSILSSNQVRQVEAYLARKWGLQSNVLAGTSHPYRYAPAVVLPTQISGCALWLDAADPNGTGVRPSNGTAISTWVDKSGNGNSFFNNATYTPWANATSNIPTYTTNGLNGLPVVSFTSNSSQSLAGPDIFAGIATQPFTIVYVTNTIIFARGRDDVGGTGWSIQMNSLVVGGRTGQNYHALFRNGAGGEVQLVAGTQSGGQIYSLDMSNVSSNFTLSAYQTGTLTGTATDTGIALRGNPTTFQLNYFGYTGTYNTGYVAEVLVYRDRLTTTQRQQIEGYLAWKWGLQGNLTSGGTAHPYKSFRP